LRERQRAAHYCNCEDDKYSKETTIHDASNVYLRQSFRQRSTEGRYSQSAKL
jgi:hypothetical protein